MPLSFVPLDIFSYFSLHPKKDVFGEFIKKILWGILQMQNLRFLNKFKRGTFLDALLSQPKRPLSCLVVACYGWWHTKHIRLSCRGTYHLDHSHYLIYTMQVFSGLSIYLQKLSTIVAAFYYLALYLLRSLSYPMRFNKLQRSWAFGILKTS